MTGPTPAVERATEAMRRMPFTPHDYTSGDVALAALIAGLADPADDPDWLARTLFVLDRCTSGWTAAEALVIWARVGVAAEDARAHWRAVADGLRMMLTGSGS